jgi:hypothetical protein
MQLDPDQSARMSRLTEIYTLCCLRGLANIGKILFIDIGYACPETNFGRNLNMFTEKTNVNMLLSQMCKNVNVE